MVSFTHVLKTCYINTKTKQYEFKALALPPKWYVWYHTYMFTPKLLSPLKGDCQRDSCSDSVSSFSFSFRGIYGNLPESTIIMEILFCPISDNSCTDCCRFHRFILVKLTWLFGGFTCYIRDQKFSKLVRSHKLLKMDLTAEIPQDIKQEASQTTGKSQFTYSRSFWPEIVMSLG